MQEVEKNGCRKASSAESPWSKPPWQATLPLSFNPPITSTLKGLLTSGRISLALIGILAGGFCGIVCGCIIGYFAAHYFPFFGGLAMMGEPHSGARDSLVPGHMLLFAGLLGLLGGIVLGLLGFVMGSAIDKEKGRRR